MASNDKQNLERQKLHFEHQLKEVDAQSLTAAERDKLKEQLQASLKDVEDKLTSAK